MYNQNHGRAINRTRGGDHARNRAGKLGGSNSLALIQMLTDLTKPSAPEMSYGELHSHLYISDEQKAKDAQFQLGYNAYLKYETFQKSESIDWQNGYNTAKSAHPQCVHARFIDGRDCDICTANAARVKESNTICTCTHKKKVHNRYGRCLECACDGGKA